MRLEGSCHCRAVVFSLDSTHPYPYQRCYCSICRKTQGGGGYAINLSGDALSMAVTGRDQISVYHAKLPGEDGQVQESTAERHFCSQCGSALWLFSPGGDELNLIERGANYGYPIVSNGVHYDGRPIPDHDTRPEFKAPAISWTPAISPAGFIIYDGELFPQWQGSGFIGGLTSLGLVRVEFEGESAREAERFDLQRRIREVEQGPDGAIWLLEDGRRGGNGALLKLTPRR